MDDLCQYWWPRVAGSAGQWIAVAGPDHAIQRVCLHYPSTSQCKLLCLPLLCMLATMHNAFQCKHLWLIQLWLRTIQHDSRQQQVQRHLPHRVGHWPKWRARVWYCFYLRHWCPPRRDAERYASPGHIAGGGQRVVCCGQFCHEPVSSFSLCWDFRVDSDSRE